MRKISRQFAFARNTFFSDSRFRWQWERNRNLLIHQVTDFDISVELTAKKKRERQLVGCCKQVWVLGLNIEWRNSYTQAVECVWRRCHRSFLFHTLLCHVLSLTRTVAANSLFPVFRWVYPLFAHTRIDVCFCCLHNYKRIVLNMAATANGPSNYKQNFSLSHIHTRTRSVSVCIQMDAHSRSLTHSQCMCECVRELLLLLVRERENHQSKWAYCEFIFFSFLLGHTLDCAVLTSLSLSRTLITIHSLFISISLCGVCKWEKWGKIYVREHSTVFFISFVFRFGLFFLFSFSWLLLMSFVYLVFSWIQFIFLLSVPNDTQIHKRK